MLRRLPR